MYGKARVSAKIVRIVRLALKVGDSAHEHVELYKSKRGATNLPRGLIACPGNRLSGQSSSVREGKNSAKLVVAGKAGGIVERVLVDPGNREAGGARDYIHKIKHQCRTEPENDPRKRSARSGSILCSKNFSMFLT